VINLIILSDAFPSKDGKDIRGTYVKDYAKSVIPFCNVKIITFKKSNQTKIVEYEIDGYKVLSYNILYNKKYKILSKISYFSKIYFLGYRLIYKKFKNTDIIHAHGSVLSGLLARIVSKKLNIPYVITEHTGPFSKISNYFLKKYFSKKSIEGASALLCVSHDLKNQIINCGIVPKKTIVTYNPVDTKLFSKKPINIDNKKIIFVSRLEKYKGASKVLKVFSEIYLNHSNWSLSIIGDGFELPFLKQFVLNNNLEKSVVLHGALSKSDIAIEMQNSSFFILPSRHETFGLVVAEAMSSGLPVITSNTTALPEFVDGNSGFLIDPNSYDDINSAMEKMINNYHKFDSDNIRATVVENFGLVNFGKKLESIYESVIK
jgi:L-malate glycosyltransferase